MAGEGDNGVEMRAHEKGYSLFVGIVKWGAIVAAIVVLLIILVLA